MRTVHLVVAGGIPLAVYAEIGPAYVHVRTITGAMLFELPLLTQVPQSVRDDLSFDDDGDTPIDDPDAAISNRKTTKPS